MQKSLRLCAVVTALVMSGAAHAADLRPILKAPPPPPLPPVYNWTGFYFGGHAGYAWSHQNYSLPTGAALGGTIGEGLIGGGQIGYNWQTGSWVLGAEADASWAHLRKGLPYLEQDNIVTPNGPLARGRIGTTVESLGSVAGRVGHAWDCLLFYAKGGAAWTNDLYRNFNGDLPSEPLLYRATRTRWGWMAGAGLEYGLTLNWSVKIEYDYFAFGSERITLTSIPSVTPPTRNFDIKENISLVKLGINYRFSASSFFGT